MTPLYAAVRQGHREVVQLLIAAGPLGGLEDLSSEGRKGTVGSLWGRGDSLSGVYSGQEELSDPETLRQMICK